MITKKHRCKSGKSNTHNPQSTSTNTHTSHNLSSKITHGVLNSRGASPEGEPCPLTRGAPDSPVHHRTLSGADFFPILAQSTVDDLEPLAHRTLSGAHRIVRCPHQTVGSATRHARIARPTVGSPDSPVHHRIVR
jgi:hypothetical protein